MEEILNKENPFLDFGVNTQKTFYKYCVSLFIRESGGVQKAINKLNVAYVQGKLKKAQYYRLKYCILNN